MPTSLLEYRLRIRNASTVLNPDGTADALILSSVRGGDNPYITRAPDGDGLQFDPIRGTVRSGSYTVMVADAITSGTNRVVTSQLVDAQNRQQLISRRAYLEFRVNGGAWGTLIAGYILGIKLKSALTYQFTIGDSRRIEQTKKVFTKDDAYFNIRGAIIGGPIVNYNRNASQYGYGPFVDRCGWKFRVSAVNGLVADLEFLEGYNGANGRVTNKWTDILKAVPAKSGYGNYIDGVAAPYVDPNSQIYPGVSGNGSIYSFVGLTLKTYLSQGGALYADAVPLSPFAGSQSITGGYGDASKAHLRAKFPSSVPSVGTTVYASLITVTPSEDSAMYVTGHPVDITRNLYLSQNIPIDSASFDALKTLQGDFYRYTMRVTEPRTLSEVLEEICGPFGIGLRVSSAGAIQAFSSRIKTSVIPTVQVDTAGTRGSGDDIFDLEESTVVTSITTDSLIFNGVDSQNTDSGADVPLDGIVVANESITVENADVAAFSSKAISYSLNGMIHSTNWYGTQLSLFTFGMAGEIFDRYGRGAVGGNLQCLRGVGGIDGVQVGDEIYVNVAQLPNNGKRLGDDPSVGARVMQIVRRTETPSGPELRLLDSGSINQPATTPTITIAKSATASYSTATFTITNAAAINALNNLTVAVQYAFSATQPTTDGTIFTRYLPGQAPTSATSLPPAPPATGVWVRARTESALGRPSAWTAWQGVTLDALAGPSGASALTIWRNAVLLGWTNTSSTLPLEVFIAPSGTVNYTAPQYRVGQLTPNSTRFTYRLLSGPGVSYIAAIRYALSDGNGSTPATVSFTTNSATDTTYRPAGIAIIQSNASLTDSSTRQGIPVALWPSNPALTIEVQRAPDVAGAPGTATTVATVSGATTVFTDYSLPDTTAVYWYRARHVLGGFTETDYTCWKSSTVIAVPQDIQRPSAVAPVIVPSFLETSTDATITLAITDPQCRVDVVRFRHRTGGGAWSAWTVDTTSPYSYTQSLPATGFLDIEYEVLGFNAAGEYGTLSGEVVSFDRGTSADMVSVVGTFTSIGDLTLAISADSDTASIKYAVSAISQPTLATTQAATAVNGRNVATTIAGPFALGSTVYVSALGYTGVNGTGSESVLFQYRFTRGDSGLTYVQCLATADSSTATQIVVTVTGTAPAGSGTPTVQLVSVTGSATLASGAAIGTPVASGSSWTFNRGAALGQPGGAQFRAVLSGAQSDDDFIEIPEQGRDTTYLQTRARVLSTSNTQVIVRVAVLDKYSALSSTIGYIATGVGTVTPATNQVVTTAVGDTFASPETAGSYVDFTIDRPAFQAGAGRVTFTATATSRVSDSDAVDVPAVEQDTRYTQCIATVNTSGTTATQISVTVTATGSGGTPTVQLVSITGSATLASGAAIGTPVGSGSVWVFNRGAALGPNGGAQFRAVLANNQSDDDFIEIPEQGRDTTYLASRARVTATTDTTVTARYAVADPYPQGTNTVTVAYQNLGSPGVTPASGGTLTPQSTLTEAAGTYIDYTITRPPFGAGTARVTFTATAANRVSDSDAVDVPAIERDTISLSARARITSTTATTQVVRVAVADPQPTYTISSITGSTVTTNGPHNQSGTFTVIISGNSNAAYNGTWTATVLTSLTFSISTSSTSGTGGTAAPQNYATITYQVIGLATPTQVGGATLPATITVTPQTSLNESPGTFYDFQITRPAAAQPPGRINFTITATGRAPAAPAASVVAQDIVGPSLSVVTTPSSLTYSLVVTWDGTIAYALDGSSQSVAGWTSPRTVTITRNDYLGATQVAAFSSTKDGSTISESVSVPPKDNAGASITIGTQTADNTTNTYTFTWSTSGMPAGTTYDLTYTTTTTSGVIEQGTLNSQTSPVNIVSGFSIGVNPKYQMTVTAIKSGTLVLVKSRSGTFFV